MRLIWEEVAPDSQLFVREMLAKGKGAVQK